MRKQFNQCPPKTKTNKRWLMGAIAMPVFLGLVWGIWFLPNRKIQSDFGRLSETEKVILADQQREALLNRVGAIATAAGGVFLLFNLRTAKKSANTVSFSGADFRSADLSGTDFSGVELNGADLSDADLTNADFSGADLNGAELSGANLSGANLNGADLISANLSGANLSDANLRYANLSGADLSYVNLSGADLRYANLSSADLNCTLLSDANLSEANLSSALLFFTNLREVSNLEPLQLEASPSPFLCNVALPAYSQQPQVNPNRACDRIPQLLSDRYHIPLDEARGIVNEARQHRWD